MSSAQNIRLGPDGGIAPTPQNTPANHLSNSVLSRPQVPQTLAEEGEDGGDDKDEMPTISSRAAAAAGGASSKDQQAASAAAALSGNPLFAQMVQGKLSSLVGRSSGYIESLAPAVQRRVTSLKALQAEHQKIEADFQREIFELEKRFAQKYAPLYDRRRELVLGQSEPTDDEVKRGQEADDADEFVDDDDADDDDVVADAKKQNKPAYADLTPDEIASAPKGVPEFWLTALKNHVGIADLITERDEDILKHLVDIKVEYPSDNKPGFKLVFHFSPEGASDFFADGRSTLDKTYYYQDEIGYEGDFIYDHAVGTEIKWKEGQDPTTRIETKKQRNKNTNQTRVVKKVVPTESFFTFFSPPKLPSEDDDDEDIDEDVEERLELDYQIGEDLKERVVPRAIDFFTGKALRYEQDATSLGSDDEFDDDDDFEDDDDDDDDAGSARRAPQPPSGNTPASHQDPQECKQQ